jgi:mycofactocin precursor
MSESPLIDGADPVASAGSLLAPADRAEGAPPASGPPEPDDLDLVELLVEEVSIDGMCGVY